MPSSRVRYALRGAAWALVLLGAFGMSGCAASAYTSIRPGENGTYYLTSVKQVFSVVTSELLWCEPVPPSGNLRCRVVGE